MSLRIPSYSLYSNCISLYDSVFTDSGEAFRTGNRSINQVCKFNHNKLSRQARAKLERTIHNFLILANEKKVYIQSLKKQVNFKLAFITLTLAHDQVHSDKIIKQELLHQFFVEIGKRYKIQNYVWKAERQENGNLHFHIIIDKFIHWSELRDIWNRIQNKLGYVDRHRQAMKEFYKFGFKINERYLKFSPIPKQHEYYAKGLQSDWSSPNSTDIHSTANITELASYMAKYMLKGLSSNRIKQKRNSWHYPKSSVTTVPDGSFWDFQKNRKKSVSFGAKKYLGHVCNNGRIWGCSYALSRIQAVKDIFEREIQAEVAKLQTLKGVRKYVTDYCTCIYFNFKTIIKHNLVYIRDKLLNYLSSVTGIPVQLSFI